MACRIISPNILPRRECPTARKAARPSSTNWWSSPSLPDLTAPPLPLPTLGEGEGGRGEWMRAALKVFKPRYRIPALVTLADRLAAFADLPGLQVCRRTVLTMQRPAPPVPRPCLRRPHALGRRPHLDGSAVGEA